MKRALAIGDLYDDYQDTDGLFDTIGAGISSAVNAATNALPANWRPVAQQVAQGAQGMITQATQGAAQSGVLQAAQGVQRAVSGGRAAPAPKAKAPTARPATALVKAPAGVLPRPGGLPVAAFQQPIDQSPQQSPPMVGPETMDRASSALPWVAGALGVVAVGALFWAIAGSSKPKRPRPRYQLRYR